MRVLLENLGMVSVERGGGYGSRLHVDIVCGRFGVQGHLLNDGVFW
jgi:hypothetical protein